MHCAKHSVFMFLLVYIFRHFDVIVCGAFLRRSFSESKFEGHRLFPDVGLQFLEITFVVFVFFFCCVFKCYNVEMFVSL